MHLPAPWSAHTWATASAALCSAEGYGGEIRWGKTWGISWHRSKLGLMGGCVAVWVEWRSMGLGKSYGLWGQWPSWPGQMKIHRKLGFLVLLLVKQGVWLILNYTKWKKSGKKCRPSEYSHPCYNFFRFSLHSRLGQIWDQMQLCLCSNHFQSEKGLVAKLPMQALAE